MLEKKFETRFIKELERCIHDGFLTSYDIKVKRTAYKLVVRLKGKSGKPCDDFNFCKLHLHHSGLVVDRMVEYKSKNSHTCIVFLKKR